jgi:hypothetical protein
VRQAGGETWLAGVDLASGRAWEWRDTAPERPLSPTWLDGRVLYVRGSAPGGLRALDVASGRRHDVVLRGIESRPLLPAAVQAHDGRVAVTMVAPDEREPERRWIVRASAAGAPQGGLDLVVESGTGLRLFDDALAWVPGTDLLVASVIAGGEPAPGDRARRPNSALCLVRADGGLRRLTYDVDRARLPRLRGLDLVFIDGHGRLLGTTLHEAALRVDDPAVFGARPAPRSP